MAKNFFVKVTQNKEVRLHIDINKYVIIIFYEESSIKIDMNCNKSCDYKLIVDASNEINKVLS
jgi:hypothetical protein